jgi:hypothetical protein
MKVDYFIDNEGWRRARFPKPFQVLGEFLESDVQVSEYYFNLLLDICKKIGAKELDEWSDTGNAYTVTIKNNTVTVEAAYEWVQKELPACTISIDEFRQILRGWFQFLIDNGQSVDKEKVRANLLTNG